MKCAKRIFICLFSISLAIFISAHIFLLLFNIDRFYLSDIEYYLKQNPSWQVVAANPPLPEILTPFIEAFSEKEVLETSASAEFYFGKNGKGMLGDYQFKWWYNQESKKMVLTTISPAVTLYDGSYEILFSKNKDLMVLASNNKHIVAKKAGFQMF